MDVGDRLGFLQSLSYEEKRQLFLNVAGNVLAIAVVWAIFVAVKKGRGVAGV